MGLGLMLVVLVVVLVVVLGVVLVLVLGVVLKIFNGLTGVQRYDKARSL
jgi:hypothetical protein